MHVIIAGLTLSFLLSTATSAATGDEYSLGETVPPSYAGCVEKKITDGIIFLREQTNRGGDDLFWFYRQSGVCGFYPVPSDFKIKIKKLIAEQRKGKPTSVWFDTPLGKRFLFWPLRSEEQERSSHW